MTGLAQILKAQSVRVSGSDAAEEFFTDAVLKRLRIPVFRGFRASHIQKDADLVIASTAYLEKSQIPNLKSQTVMTDPTRIWDVAGILDFVVIRDLVEISDSGFGM